MKTARPYLKRSPLTGRKTKGAFTLIEITIAIVILSIMGGMIAMASAGMERSLAVADAQSALNDELTRQAEIVKGTPISVLNSATYFNTAAPGTVLITIPAANVNPLNGFLPQLNTAGAIIKPVIKWTRVRADLSAASSIGHPILTDTITITATTQSLNIPLTATTTVIRVFDANQQ